MTNETKHTPTPWYVDTGSYGDVWIVGDKENWVPRICHIPDYSKANAAHIVRCVNMHDELVEALRDLLTFVVTVEYQESPIVAFAEAALAKARGEVL